ncbi:hypothetical protein DFS34DRAFT_133306 [Phlyctochytrium arcticum]|nr:hypothetical protein DFS34DRAFT_133306 [Phlyctochytrium arcticum]
MYAVRLGDTTDKDKLLWKLCRYILVGMHEKMHPTPGRMPARDRATEWIGTVIPFLSPICITGLISWRWCEQPSLARAMTDPEDGTAPEKFGHAVGLSMIGNSEEILVQSSGTENAPDPVAGSLQLVENTTRTLKHFIAQYKDSAFATMRKKTVMGVEHFNERLTLTFTSPSEDVGKWEIMEVRSALLPFHWGDKGKALRVLELIATIFLNLYEQESIRNDVVDEINRFVEVPEEHTVRQILRPSTGL